MRRYDQTCNTWGDGGQTEHIRVAVWCYRFIWGWVIHVSTWNNSKDDIDSLTLMWRTCSALNLPSRALECSQGLKSETDLSDHYSSENMGSKRLFLSVSVLSHYRNLWLQSKRRGGSPTQSLDSPGSLFLPPSVGFWPNRTSIHPSIHPPAFLPYNLPFLIHNKPLQICVFMVWSLFMKFYLTDWLNACFRIECAVEISHYWSSWPPTEAYYDW